MLDRCKLIKELAQHGDKLFTCHADEYLLARKVWGEITHDVTFVHKLKAASVPWALPSWQGDLGAAVPVRCALQPLFYQALAIDGSQVYPDRHQGNSCFLINIGSVAITYQVVSAVQVSSTPYLFTADDYALATSQEFVNCRRQELELRAGLQLYADLTKDQTVNRLLLLDGSLIFWHLKEEAIKEHFMPIYLELLHQLYLQRVPFACYISLPKSKDLTNLIRASLSDFHADDAVKTTAVDHVTDAAIAHFFLDPWTRTTIFASNQDVCKEYPPHLRPHFVYVHVEDEIVRIEFPAWIAQDAQLLDNLLEGIADQCRKGRGYPVVLAEAHEQAVVKGPDRDFFYQLITKVGIEQRQRILISQKSAKKRGMSV